jgi:hypothetical protein
MTELEQSRDPSTAPARLALLARHPDFQVRRRVAANPNTPVDVLCGLAPVLPVDVGRNPLVPVLWLEAGGDWAQVPPALVAAVASSGVQAPDVLAWALACPAPVDVAFALMTHPQVPRAARRALFTQARTDAERQQLARHLPLGRWEDLLGAGWLAVLRRAGFDTWADSDAVSMDLDLDECDCSACAAQREPAEVSWTDPPSVDARRFPGLPRDGDGAKLLEMGALGVELACEARLVTLAQLLHEAEQPQPRPLLLERLAAAPGCPPALLEQLAAAPFVAVRVAVASQGGQLPVPLQLLLAQDPSSRVRVALCKPPGEREPAVAEAAWLQLAADPHPWVLEQVARGLPPHLREQLLQDTPMGRALVAGCTDRAFVALVARHPSLPLRCHAARVSASGLAHLDLAWDPAVEVRLALAENPEVHPEALVQLTRDAQPKVRRAAVEARRLPLEELERLWNDPHPEVRRAARHQLAQRR